MYKITYVIEAQEDRLKIDASEQRVIAKAINSKLKISPYLFGKTLRTPLFPWKSLRVGNYRVIFDIEEDEVVIWGIGHRKEVYEFMRKRKPL
jgi:mRNA interferase RelE/StbE